MAEYSGIPPYDGLQQQGGLRGESIAMVSPFETPTQGKQGYTASSIPVPSEDASARKLSYDHHQSPLISQPANSRQQRWSPLAWGVKYGLVVVLVAVILAIPIIVFRSDEDIDSDESLASKQYKNLVFYLFAWLEITWLSGCVMDMFILGFPFLFRTVARFVNPAHKRYWRTFRALRMPVTLLGVIVGAFVGFDTLIFNNDLLAVNFDIDPNEWRWDNTIDDILQQCTFWVAFYLVEKIVILYISIHYHYRSDQGRITHSKEMHSALVTLYEASIYLHPVNSSQFVSEDAMIHGKTSSKNSSISMSPEKDANKFLEKIGIIGDKAGSFFGKSKSNPSSHWLNTSSSYTVVERAISNPTSAAALAKRIWMSLVVRGKEALTAEDVAEVLGPYRRDEAIECFKVLDENESGDLLLEEMVWTVIEVGRIRQSIYQGMTDINHCINTLDWIGVLILAAVMVFFISVLYVPTIKEIQNTVSIIAVGLSFALGRTVHKFIAGCIFIFFEHPFDVGDRVEIYNITAAIQVSAIVTRQSILYTVFRRIDNGSDLQITNERLALKRIENITRSGVNREQRTICVDFKTSFVDLMFLRTELEAFLKENARDYLPALGLSIVNLHELNKLELKVSVTHKSNWSEERLRATRSNKFMCALVAAVRKIPLGKPGGLKQGDEARPIYHVNIDSEEGKEAVNAAKKKAAESRIDFVKPTPKEGGEVTDGEAEKVAEQMRKEEEAVAKENEARAGLAKIPELKKTLVQDEFNESITLKVNDMVKHISTGLRMKPGID